MALLFILTSLLVLLAPLRGAQGSASVSDLSLHNMDFAMTLYRKVASSHDKNIFFSPLSVSSSFAALLMASGGQTRRELLRGLNLERLERPGSPEQIPQLFHLLQQNVSRNGSLQLHQGMAIFIQQTFQVEPRFQEDLKTFFHADIRTVDFGDAEASVSSINQYVKLQTGDKVREMISSLDELTRLLLVNTIFFQGSWELPFNPNLTQSAPFHIDNYNIVQVPMMFKEDKFYTMEDVPLGARVLKLPYRDGVSMLILLPNKGLDYTEIDEEISAQRFQSWIQKLQKTKLEVNLPRFSLEQSYPLHSVLPHLGITSIFSSAANLTHLSQDQGLMVSEVLHKAVMEVDESGTTAAAATATGIIPYSLPRTFTVNRPFFFFIYSEDTNCLLFMGRVVDPTKK